MQLGGQPVTKKSASYQKVSHLLSVSQQRHMALQSTFKSDIVWLTAGSCIGSASGEWPLEVPIYCGPHIGHKIVVMGFPLSLTRRGLSTGPTGIQDTETLVILDGRDIY